MGFSSRVNIDNFNYDLLIDRIRPNLLNIQETVQKGLSDVNEIKEQMKKELRMPVKQYIQSYDPSYISVINEIIDEVYAKMYGLNLLDKYLDMKDVSDVFLFGKKIMYIENGKRVLAKDTFNSLDEVKVLYKKIASNAGQNISTQEPSTDAELLDGSRVLMIIEPEAIEPYIVIRKHTKSNVSIDDLELRGLDFPVGTHIEKKRININDSNNLSDFVIRDYLKKAVENRRNIIFVGGTGSGKTTFMNSLTYYIQSNHIVAVLEDTRELNLPIPYVYYLKTRKGDGATVKDITYEDILNDCLRANPDRILLTEIRSGESAYALLQVLNSGHGGSMTSIHANSSLDAIDRLEELITEHKNIPKRSLRGLISKAVDIVVYLQLDEDEHGNKTGRAIKEILEVNGLNKKNDEYLINYVYLNT